MDEESERSKGEKQPGVNLSENLVDIWDLAIRTDQKVEQLMNQILGSYSFELIYSIIVGWFKIIGLSIDNLQNMKVLCV